LKDPHINVGMFHCPSKYFWQMKGLGTEITTEVKTADTSGVLPVIG
jgi:hypothetical protein